MKALTATEGRVEYHWAVEVPDGDRARLVKYQTRERPARMSAEHGGHRLLCRQVRFDADGTETYAPWRDAALAGLVNQPAENHDLTQDPHLRANCTCSFCHYARQDKPAPADQSWIKMDDARPQPKPADAETVEAVADDRIYFVYRESSALPLLAGWRDEQAALQYAKDSNAAIVIGVDVIYRAIPPFDSGVTRRPRGVDE